MNAHSSAIYMSSIQSFSQSLLRNRKIPKFFNQELDDNLKSSLDGIILSLDKCIFTLDHKQEIEAELCISQYFELARVDYDETMNNLKQIYDEEYWPFIRQKIHQGIYCLILTEESENNIH